MDLPYSLITLSDMRTLIAIAAVAALTGSALAGVLPIAGTFCGSGDNADIVLNSSGIHGAEDGCTFRRVISSGNHSWVLAQECSNTADEPMTKVKIKNDIATVSDYWKPTAKYLPPYILRRCPS